MVGQVRASGRHVVAAGRGGNLQVRIGQSRLGRARGSVQVPPDVDEAAWNNMADDLHRLTGRHPSTRDGLPCSDHMSHCIHQAR